MEKRTKTNEQCQEAMLLLLCHLVARCAVLWRSPRHLVSKHLKGSGRICISKRRPEKATRFFLIARHEPGQVPKRTGEIVLCCLIASPEGVCLGGHWMGYPTPPPLGKTGFGHFGQNYAKNVTKFWRGMIDCSGTPGRSRQPGLQK